MRTLPFLTMANTVAAAADTRGPLGDRPRQRTHHDRGEASHPAPRGPMRCYRPVVNERLCPRCGAPAQPGGKVCEHCELPLDGPAAVRYNPAGLALPSPIQGHATVVVDVRVGNDGSRGGKARCQVRAVKPDGSLVSSAVQLTPTIPGHADLVIRLRGEGM